MTQETFPEIKEAIEALEKRVTLTEGEIAQLKEDIKSKKAQVKTWRKALAAFYTEKGRYKEESNRGPIPCRSGQLKATWFKGRRPELPVTCERPFLTL
jgi:hypothetical protein